MGLAYLPDGRRMPYEEYLKTPEWRNKKANRLAFDNWQCGICHESLSDGYETHHINYSRLGDENVEKDIISICRECHSTFHNLWEKSKTWETESPYMHWKAYSLLHTAALCFMYMNEDFMYGSGDYNLCSLDTIQGFIDRYFKECEISEPVRICEDDVRLFFRNKRYELFFEASSVDDFDFEAWLDSRYGKKGGAGGNKRRSEARSFFKRHKLSAMKRIYKESDVANILMKEVRKYAETKRI